MITEQNEDNHIQLVIQNTSLESQEVFSEITLDYAAVCLICSSNFDIDDTCM